VAKVMTQQYLSGELSTLLYQLRTVTTCPQHAREVERLRLQAETLPVGALGRVMACALDLTEALCWESLARGDAAAFARQAEVSAQMYEFGVCAGLLADG
jgi:hypothetical protein